MIVLSQCHECKHYKGKSACAAFPDGIPVPIKENEHDHRKPYPGDNGIQFEPIEADDANRTPPNLD